MHDSIADSGWLALFCALTVLGSGWGSLLVLPLFASPRSRRFAKFLTAAIVTNAIVIGLLKVIVRRPRPFLVLPDVHALVFEAPGGWSFPSGHSAGSFSFAMFAAIVLLRGPDYGRHPALRTMLAFSLLVAAAGVAASRVALGVHFPSDILVGAVIGSSVGAYWARRYLATGTSTPYASTSPSTDHT